jgi:peptidoglycan hydrolase CwlO-like protein
MKKTILFVIVMIFTFSSTFAFAGDGKSKSDKSANPVTTENKLSELESNRLTNRVDEIRNRDKTNLSSIQKRELKKETKEINENLQHGGDIYIGSGALIVLIIILIVVLF